MKLSHIILTLTAAVILTACGTTNTVPITGRKTHLLVSDQQVLSLSNTQYQDYMKTAKLSTNAQETAMVKRVGTRLANAVETYLKNNGYEQEIKNFQWEFNLVQNQEVNAFCMPGGKIVVYEGLLPVTKDEQSLAIVLGHEIAHAVAKHSAEQLSEQIRQQYATQIGTAVTGAALGSGASSILKDVANTGFKFSNLKYSRDNESEADHLGLIFAAMAGYDPQCAVPFWQRMASGKSSNKSDMFSDHPSDEKRIAALQKEMPEAMKYYDAYKAQHPDTQASTTATSEKTASASTQAKAASAKTANKGTAIKKTSTPRKVTTKKKK